MKIKLLLIGAILFFAGCKKILEPDAENLKGLDQMDTDINFAHGFLANGYRLLPGYYDNSEYATDDAVTNVRTDNFLRIGTGSWTAANNPLSRWDPSFGSIQYINQFLAKVNDITWARDQEANELFKLRLKGEAYGLRAIHMYYLLRAHGGFTEDGQLMGVPIITSLKTPDSILNLPRASFDECVKFIYRDLDSAEAKLPMEYGDVTAVSQIPARYQTITKNTGVYSRVMGLSAQQLVNALIAKSFRTRVALLAASPAFQHSSNTATWQSAADYAAQLIDYKGGVSQLPTNGWTYYKNTSEIDALSNGLNTPEMIWRENKANNNSDQEDQNYPPSLFGRGLMNPSQSLVDAFPMANGYPINRAEANYQAGNPYASRDPRLVEYIIYDGSKAGPANTTILTGSASGTFDAINARTTSTRTGYYMKKRLIMSVNRNPTSISGKNHIIPRIRYTEIYLAYAEAANEAFGPTGTGTHAYSAYDVIKRIRTRAGVGTSNGDPYLEECKADKNKMRELIRNERRIELSFESFRFWDLRRWKVSLPTLNETVKGMDASTGFSVFPVENRVFQDYMYYGPIPFSETLKFSNLKQNKGWR
jgi:starch-binding outer membrane protein, SusD/RagB family